MTNYEVGVDGTLFFRVAADSPEDAEEKLRAALLHTKRRGDVLDHTDLFRTSYKVRAFAPDGLYEDIPSVECSSTVEDERACGCPR